MGALTAGQQQHSNKIQNSAIKKWLCFTPDSFVGQVLTL